MEHQVSIIENIPHITPVKSRVEVIVKLDPPKNPKNCKQFCGVVNYLLMFLKNLQTKLIPICHLTKKGVPFHWGQLQQKAFEMIKKDLTEVAVLAMPNNERHMCMIPVPVIVLYLCCTLVSTLNSTELHLQGVAPRSQYSDPVPEVVTLQ